MLHAGGSAPGLDGIPYDVLHHGAGLVGALTCQAHHLAHRGTHLAALAIGPAADLLVWIPKAEGSETTDGCRPFQPPS